MKKLIYFLSTTVLLSVVVSSCTQVDLPYETFNDLQKGAYPRTLASSGDYNLSDVPSSAFVGEVEFYSEVQGANVASYDWTVQFIDNGGGSGSIAPTDWVKFPASSFGTSTDGLPSVGFTFDMQAAMDALGKTLADLGGGDVIRFNATLVLDDGRTFDADRTGSNIFSSSSFKAMFTVDMPMVCIMAATEFNGDYNLTMSATGTFGSAFLDQVVTVSQGPTTTKRQFDAIYLEQAAIGNGPMTFVFDLICDTVVPDDEQGSGLGCGGGTIFFAPPPNADRSAFDLFDDSVITINAYEFSNGGNCGAEDDLITIILTKI